LIEIKNNLIETNRIPAKPSIVETAPKLNFDIAFDEDLDAIATYVYETYERRQPTVFV